MLRRPLQLATLGIQPLPPQSPKSPNAQGATTPSANIDAPGNIFHSAAFIYQQTIDRIRIWRGIVAVWWVLRASSSRRIGGCSYSPHTALMPVSAEDVSKGSTQKFLNPRGHSLSGNRDSGNYQLDLSEWSLILRVVGSSICS